MATYSIDIATGTSTALSSASWSGSWGTSNFAIDAANDKFYYITTSSGVQTLRSGALSTGVEASPIVITGTGGIDSIEINASGNVVGLDLGSGALTPYTINPSTGVATAGTTFSIASPSGQGFSFESITIDPVDGGVYAATYLNSTTSHYLYKDGLQTTLSLNDSVGLTALAAVPEPAATAIAAGLLTLGFAMISRRRGSPRPSA